MIISKIIGMKIQRVFNHIYHNQNEKKTIRKKEINFNFTINSILINKYLFIIYFKILFFFYIYIIILLNNKNIINK